MKLKKDIPIVNIAADTLKNDIVEDANILLRQYLWEAMPLSPSGIYNT